MINIEKQYIHNTAKKGLDNNKKCTMCNKMDLMMLPEEFQRYSRNRNYVSYFCCTCLQIVNFMLVTE